MADARQRRAHVLRALPHHAARAHVEILALPDVGSATRRAQYDAARKALEDWSLGVLEDPCTEAATDWGDRHGDSERARRAGWHPVECPGTRNAYWIATRRAGAVLAELARGAR